MLDASRIADFKAKLRGQVIEPKDPNYEDARSLYNGMIDKRPRLIAQCANAADVMAAVNFGRDLLLVAMQQFPSVTGDAITWPARAHPA